MIAYSLVAILGATVNLGLLWSIQAPPLHLRKNILHRRNNNNSPESYFSGLLFYEKGKRRIEP